VWCQQRGNVAVCTERGLCCRSWRFSLEAPWCRAALQTAADWLGLPHNNNNNVLLRWSPLGVHIDISAIAWSHVNVSTLAQRVQTTFRLSSAPLLLLPLG